MPTVVKKNQNGDTEVIPIKSTITQIAKNSLISQPKKDTIDDIQNPINNDISLGKINKQIPLATIAFKKIVEFFTRTGTKDPEEKISQKSNSKVKSTDINKVKDNNSNSESIESLLNTTTHQINELMKLTPEKLAEMGKLQRAQEYLDFNEISTKISPAEAIDLKNAGKTLSNTESKSSDKDNKVLLENNSANKSSQKSI